MNGHLFHIGVRCTFCGCCLLIVLSCTNVVRCIVCYLKHWPRCYTLALLGLRRRQNLPRYWLSLHFYRIQELGTGQKIIERRKTPVHVLPTSLRLRRSLSCFSYRSSPTHCTSYDHPSDTFVVIRRVGKSEAYICTQSLSDTKLGLVY